MNAQDDEPRTTRRAVTLGAVALALMPHSVPGRQVERGPATLLVRGQAELPPGAAMAWRVVRDVAEAGAAANFERRALGFAVAASPFTSLLLTDEATGSAYRLAPGEVAFVREGVMQRRESLGDSPQAYLRIGLVAAEAVGDAGGDRALYASPPFAAPAGLVTLQLERLPLNAGETGYVTPGLGRSLLLVEQGEVELEEGEAAPHEVLQTVVGSDTSYAVSSLQGGAMIFGKRDGTSLLVATVV
jgi:hypothetical protein